MKEQATKNNGVGLLKEGLVLGLVLGAWLWGVMALGGQATAVQTSSPTSEIVPMYGDVARRASGTPADEGAPGCARKFRPAVGTSREPGADLAERSPGAER
jgi:hypothetical protein